MGGAGRVFSCRIYGVLREAGRLLLTRSRFGTREFVNFPGGGVEIGEAPIEALRREYDEETGLAIKPVRVLYSSEGCHLSTQAPIQIVSSYWLVERAGGALREGGNGDDVVSLFWRRPDELPLDEMFPAEREFCAVLPKLLALVLALLLAPAAFAGPHGESDAGTAPPTGLPGAITASAALAAADDERFFTKFLDGLQLHVKSVASMTRRAAVEGYLEFAATAGSPERLRESLGEEPLPPTRLAALTLATALARPEQFAELSERLEALRPRLGRSTREILASARGAGDRALISAVRDSSDGRIDRSRDESGRRRAAYLEGFALLGSLDAPPSSAAPAAPRVRPSRRHPIPD